MSMIFVSSVATSVLSLTVFKYGDLQFDVKTLH